MNKKNILYTGALVLCALLSTACSDTESSSMKGDKLWLSATINGIDGSQTRFDGGDGVGLWIGSGKGNAGIDEANVAVNTRFMQSAGGLVSEPRTLVNAQSDLFIYGYFPYSPLASENPHAYTFTVSARQDTFALANPRGYAENDLLWTKQCISSLERQTDKAVDLPFQHLMGRVVVNVRAKSGTKGAISGARLSLANVCNQTQVDMETGETKPTGDIVPMVSGITFDTPADGYEVSGAIIAVPQTIHAGQKALSILTRGNVEIAWEADQDIIIQSGKQLTLDVEVDQNECEVTIRDITDWTTDDNVITGTAMEDLPVYHQWEFYDRNGIRGIVVLLDETGKHGWVCSTDYAELPYCTFEFGQYWPSATSRTDAEWNIAQLRAVEPSLEHYPAAKWCDDKNRNGVTGWVLPPSDALQEFGRMVLGYDRDDNMAAFNAAVMAAPVPAAEKMPMPTMDWNDIQCAQYYLSSTLSALDRVRTAACQVGDVVFNGTNGFVDNITLQQSESGYVRAFYKF